MMFLCYKSFGVSRKKEYESLQKPQTPTSRVHQFHKIHAFLNRMCQFRPKYVCRKYGSPTSSITAMKINGGVEGNGIVFATRHRICIDKSGVFIK